MHMSVLVCSVAEDAYHKVRLGASLVQIYSALIYEGPFVVKQINRGLSALLKRDGFKHVSEAVGTGISRRDSYSVSRTTKR